jgi:hypothetical protein
MAEDWTAKVHWERVPGDTACQAHSGVPSANPAQTTCGDCERHPEFQLALLGRNLQDAMWPATSGIALVVQRTIQALQGRRCRHRGVSAKPRSFAHRAPRS